MNKDNAVSTPSPLQMAIYDKLKKEHIGKENAISMNNLAEHFNITPRTLRYCLSEIRASSMFESLILSCDDGYFIPKSREEYKRASRRIYSQAYSLLKIARKQEKKAALDGQGFITDSLIEDFTKFLAAYGD